jgi:hypothetical protein
MQLVQLHRSAPQDDIVGGLRNLADQIEAGQVEGMDVITTVVVALGHTCAKPIENGLIEHAVDYEMFSWGPRKDLFTVRGLLASICNRL